MNQSGCLTRETVLAWLENRLSPNEKLVVENHLRECVLCREALEGFSGSEVSRVRTAFADINHAMQQRLLQQEKKGLSRTMKLSLVAAVLLVLVGIFSIFRFKPVEAPMQVAQEMPRQKFEGKAPAPLQQESPPVSNDAEKPKPVYTPVEKEKSATTRSEELTNPVVAVEQLETQKEEMAEKAEEEIEEPLAADEKNQLIVESAPVASKKSDAPAMSRSARYAEKPMAVEYTGKSETTYYAVESPPRFRNGDIKLFKDYVESKMEALQTNSGKMTLSFIVDKNGKVKDAFVIKGLDAKTDSLVKEIVLQSPQWKPGRQGEQAVNVQLAVDVEVR